MQDYCIAMQKNSKKMLEQLQDWLESLIKYCAKGLNLRRTYFSRNSGKCLVIFLILVMNLLPTTKIILFLLITPSLFQIFKCLTLLSTKLTIQVFQEWCTIIVGHLRNYRYNRNTELSCKRESSVFFTFLEVLGDNFLWLVLNLMKST